MAGILSLAHYASPRQIELETITLSHKIANYSRPPWLPVLLLRKVFSRRMTPSKGFLYLLSLASVLIALSNVPDLFQNKGKDSEQLMGIFLFAAFGTGSFVIAKKLKPGQEN